MRSPGQAVADVGRKKLRRLELLHDHERLGLRAAPRLVIAREREKDDEPREDREARRQHPEHTRGPVAILEVTALGRRPPHEQHRADRDRDGTREDEDRPEQVHRLGSV